MKHFLPASNFILFMFNKLSIRRFIALNFERKQGLDWPDGYNLNLFCHWRALFNSAFLIFSPGLLAWRVQDKCFQVLSRWSGREVEWEGSRKRFDSIIQLLKIKNRRMKRRPSQVAQESKKQTTQSKDWQKI